ncbi:hydrogenase maturation nickel metallochaperone HypA [soil metagenome]
MHEFGYVDPILQAVQKRAEGRQVQRIRVRTGVHHRIAQASLQQAFDMVAEGTVAEGAVVECIPDPFTVDCADCGQQAEVADALPSCPGCGGVNVSLTGGQEVVLESIELAPTGSVAR